jgi:periplasmic protein TonB
MASRKTKAKPDAEERKEAVILPFPPPGRGAEFAAKLLSAVVPRRDAPQSTAAPKPVDAKERPAAPVLARRNWKWWEVGIAASLALHLAAAAVLQAKYGYDLERAAGAAAAVAEGASVIPIEVVVTAALPSAPTPTDATAPEATKVAVTAKAEAGEKKETAPPQRDEAALEIVPAAKETPQPDKEKQERKRARTQSMSAAANPSPAAAAHAEGRAGAGGRIDAGGRASVSSYQAEVLAHLQHYRIYPAEARSRGITGLATVHFVLAANGGVIAASLGRGSGAAILDEAALSMVHRASPFPPFPPGLARAQMNFSAPIRFDLR